VWSEWVDADSITILNSPPEVTSITMLPEGNLTANQDLTVVWEQFDLDGDLESGSEIYWMINGEREPDFDGLLTIPSESVYRDQHWSVQVIPRDGEDLGSSMTTPSRVIMNGAPEIPTISLGSGTTGYLGAPESFPQLGIANSLEDLVVLASSLDPDDEPLFFDVIWYRNGYQVPDLDGESLVPSERLDPGQIWEVQIIARDPWGLTSQSSAIVEISNLPPIPSWSTIPEISIPGSMIMFDGSSSLDPDGTVNNWLWQINGQSFSGSSAKILLGEGTHTVRLTVTDNFGLSITIQDLFSLGPVSMVSNLNSEISKTDIELSWSGNAEEYRIYRSSYSTETLDEMQLVGITSENSWNEIAPIASNLYYAVTMVVEDNEILWLDNETNVVSVDATSVINHADDSPTGSITILSIPLTLIFLILAISSLVISLQDRKRRSQ
jgi:hypothetical protein